jgi:hypothetical protein
MIHVTMRYKNGINFRRELFHRVINTMLVRLHGRTKNHTPKINTRKIRIHEERMVARFKLESIRSEISHAHFIAPGRGRRNVSDDQMGISLQSGVKHLGGHNEESQAAFHKTRVETKKRHATLASLLDEFRTACDLQLTNAFTVNHQLK